MTAAVIPFPRTHRAAWLRDMAAHLCAAADDPAVTQGRIGRRRRLLAEACRLRARAKQIDPDMKAAAQEAAMVAAGLRP